MAAIEGHPLENIEDRPFGAKVMSEKGKIEEGGLYVESFPPQPGGEILRVVDGTRTATRWFFKELTNADWSTNPEWELGLKEHKQEI